LQHQRRITRLIVLALLAACVMTGQIVRAQDSARSATYSVELASGLTLQGKLADATFQISTALGRFEVPAEQLQVLAPREPSRITCTLVTRRGDVLVGKLAADSLRLITADGSQADLKLAQIGRLNAPPSTQPTTTPAAPSAAVIHSLEGDELAVTAPDALDFHTRIAVLHLKADQVDEIVFNAPSQAAHQIRLSDGSSLSGFVAGESLEVQPKNFTASRMKVRIAALRQLDFPAAADGGPDGPRLDLASGDVLRGGLRGEFVLQTELGAMPVAADKIDRIALLSDYPAALAVTLLDGRTIKAPAETRQITCELRCGIRVDVPIEMVAGYTRSAPGFLILGATPDRSRGLLALPGGDGAFTIAEQDAVRCWREPNGNYLYFAMSEKHRPWRGGSAVVEVEYFDSSAAGEFKLEYDSTDASQAFNGAYKTNPAKARRGGSGRWKVASFEIPDARFAGSQNMHADFRLQFSGDEPLMIRTIRLERAAPKPEGVNGQ
jgi:hypothetical protein